MAEPEPCRHRRWSWLDEAAATWRCLDCHFPRSLPASPLGADRRAHLVGRRRAAHRVALYSLREAAAMRLVCLAETIIETLTMGAFWRSLLDGGPLVVADGHVWPWPVEWEGRPTWIHRPTVIFEIERDLSRCVRCGRRSDGWRRWWGGPMG